MPKQALPPVLFITRKWPPAIGGMERYSEEFAKAAAEFSDLTVHKLNGQNSGAAPSMFQIIKFGVFTAYKLIFSRKQFDNIHGGDLAVWPLIWIAQLRQSSTKTSISVHGTDIAYAFRSTFKARLYRAYLKWAILCLGNTRIIANSKASADLVKQLGFNKSVNIVPLRNAPDIKHCMNPDETVSSPYILFVGRLIKRKGCGWFIQHVLPRLPKTMSLRVAGTIIDDSEGAALENPRVTYLGPVFGEKLAKLRRQADVVIVPNIDLGPESFEGFGLTAVEGACDHGVVLAANVFGLKDAVIPDITGFLVPPGNAQAWVEKINIVQSWSARQRKQFIQNSIKTLQAEPSWVDIVRTTLDI